MALLFSTWSPPYRASLQGPLRVLGSPRLGRGLAGGWLGLLALASASASAFGLLLGFRMYFGLILGLGWLWLGFGWISASGSHSLGFGLDFGLISV